MTFFKCILIVASACLNSACANTQRGKRDVFDVIRGAEANKLPALKDMQGKVFQLDESSVSLSDDAVLFDRSFAEKSFEVLEVTESSVTVRAGSREFSRRLEGISESGEGFVIAETRTGGNGTLKTRSTWQLDPSENVVQRADEIDSVVGGVVVNSWTKRGTYR